jgi:hypothetical protein
MSLDPWRREQPCSAACRAWTVIPRYALRAPSPLLHLSAVVAAGTVGLLLVAGCLAWVASHPRPSRREAAAQPSPVARPPADRVDRIVSRPPLQPVAAPALAAPSLAPDAMVRVDLSPAVPQRNARRPDRRTYGTALPFVEDPEAAAGQARAEGKLLFLLHVSGNFEEPSARASASFMKVGTFQLVAGQKQGGNVASYFCTPDGRVLHVVPGPVSAEVLLLESRWVIDTCKLTLLNDHDGRRLREVFRRAHLERLRREHGVRPTPTFPLVTSTDVADLLHTPGLSAQGRVHLLLSTAPLVAIEKVYRPIFDELLDESVTTAPVLETSAPAGPAAEKGARDAARDFRHSPPAGSIRSGEALNALLVDLQLLAERGVTLPETPLPAGVLEHVQVCAGGEGSSPGLLLRKSIPWPALLRLDEFAPDRARVEEHVRMLGRSDGSGPADAERLRQLTADLEHLDRRMAAYVRASADEAGWYWREFPAAQRFLKQLKGSAQALGRPDAALYLNGSYALQGKNVAELVRHVTTHGLRFGPAAAGDEAVYLALHRALAACDVQARASVE